MDRKESVDAALASVSNPILANAFGLAIGLSILFFSPLRIHMQVASVMWVAMVVSSLAALLLLPIFYSGMRSRNRSLWVTSTTAPLNSARAFINASQDSGSR